MIAVSTEQLGRALKPLLLPLCAVLGLIIVYQLGNAVYTLSWAPSFSATPLSLSRPAISQRWAWFNTPLPTQVQAPVQEDVKEARINAKLLGIIERGSDSVAIIDTGRRGETSVFHEGDAITRSITLVKIERNRVLINEQGAVRSLTMAQKRSDDISVTGSDLNDAALDDETPALPVLAGLSFIQTPNGDTGLSLGTISPQILSGTPLEAGDLVLAADGNSVADIIADPNTYQELLRRDNIDIVIMRDGTEQTLSINPRAMAPNVMRMMANQNR